MLSSSKDTLKYVQLTQKIYKLYFNGVLIIMWCIHHHCMLSKPLLHFSSPAWVACCPKGNWSDLKVPHKMLLWLIRKGKFDFCFHEQSLLVLVPIPCRWASGSVCDIQYAGVCFWTQQSFVWQSAWWIAEITHSGFRMFVAKPFLWRLFFFLWFLSGGFFFCLIFPSISVKTGSVSLSQS